MSAFLPHAFAQTFRESFGAGIIGCLLIMGIYGVTTSQTYFYFVEYPKDKIWLKTLVGSPFLIRNSPYMFMFRFLFSDMVHIKSP
ncbi:hypothetical protein C8J57DRAFT_1511322 [Mycena rebaudengoi]|nr:hypothetical protein C8J57DRAFT_1511322 [Mycena rebaudengoi]